MKRLFVAMPYGERKAPLDYEEPDKTCVIDFDAVWTGILQPAIPPGYQTKRADELRQPGLIDRMYNEWLFDADIVLADLTFGNPNVYYELGIRQALSKKGTVLVACKGSKLPFDVRNQYVINYDYFAAPALRAFQADLRQAIENASTLEMDSPVHVFLPGLSIGRYLGEKSPEAKVQELSLKIRALEDALRDQRSQDTEDRLLDKIRAAATPSRVLSLYQLVSTRDIKSTRLLEQLAISLRDASYFDEAIRTLDRALEIAPDDPELLREIGFVCRKKGPLFHAQAETYMLRALELNDRDSELHGMLGGLLRRRGDYEGALIHYRRAHELQPHDLYPIVTVGAMCGALGKLAEAKEWYGKLQTTCERLIEQKHADHWTFLCLGEAATALGQQEAALAAYRRALEMKPPIEHVLSEIEMLEFLVERHFAAEDALCALPILRQYTESQRS
ncbi:tetratricopeptide repeat protein [Bradyrhizobium monzae]|uniref:tetratricopeptide repeat protein n=1 Tax=Bradyrhizobium sp. Oc8 TaxID=2876780 RepID=UPI001F349077|nr:tetratricopeptide repeat protein [Bradyrhizobium sp. Oc8]